MLKLSDASAEDVVFDLGSGDGRLLLAAVREFGVKRAVGYEIDKELVSGNKRKITDRELKAWVKNKWNQH